MSYNHFYRQIEALAKASFPSLASIDAVTWDHLVSPIEIKLPVSVKRTAEEAVRALHAVTRRPEYRAKLEPVPGISDHPTRNHSVLMAYDFHTDEEGGCHLVEVNTNASGFMIASLMLVAHEGGELKDFPPLAKLTKSFEHELALFGRPFKNGSRIAVCDDEIEQQKMRAEFLMYRDWFEKAGWNAEVREAKNIGTGESQALPDLVYNRSTDFYLEDETHAGLREAYQKRLSCLSPNPYEYWLLADKERLIQLGDENFLKEVGATAEESSAIRKVIIPTFDKSSFASLDEIWSDRKNLFFKPKRSHGGKSVYRGESVSRKVFERLMLEDILIQRFTPAQRVPTDDPRSVLSTWKFDLRFYVYEDEIHLCVARIYQGQVTNFASPMGGFTRVRF